MKLIKVNREIVSLENIKRVVLGEVGNGTKTHPYHYFIEIEYFGGEGTRIRFETDEKLAEETLAQIEKILLR